MTEKTAPRHVVVNRTPLTLTEITAIEQQFGVCLVDGQYWYDGACGAWGMDGGPNMGFVMPGLSLGGALRADASGGNTRVFINGRELHSLDVMRHQQYLPVRAGRWIITETATLTSSD
jgi:hypothetical protein